MRAPCLAGRLLLLLPLPLSLSFWWINKFLKIIKKCLFGLLGTILWNQANGWLQKLETKAEPLLSVRFQGRFSGPSVPFMLEMECGMTTSLGFKFFRFLVHQMPFVGLFDTYLISYFPTARPPQINLIWEVDHALTCQFQISFGIQMGPSLRNLDIWKSRLTHEVIPQPWGGWDSPGGFHFPEEFLPVAPPVRINLLGHISHADREPWRQRNFKHQCCATQLPMEWKQAETRRKSPLFFLMLYYKVTDTKEI